MEQSGEEVVAGLADDIIQLIEEKGAELTQSRKGMLSERKKALSGVDKLHNYTKIGDFKSLNGEGKQVLALDISRANNNRFVTGGQNNSVSISIFLLVLSNTRGILKLHFESEFALEIWKV